MKIKAFTTFILLIVATSLMAATYNGKCGTNLNWSLDTSTGILNITGYGAMNDYTNYSSSFAPWHNYNSYIRSIDIGENVESIGNWAFYGIDNVNSISIPNGIKRIGNFAFSYCSALKTVQIGVGCSEIGTYAFQYCSSLSVITIPQNVTTIGNYVFYKCTSLTSPVYNLKRFYYMPATFSGNYTIEDGIEDIMDYAFQGCNKLTSITLPNTIKRIGYSAFQGCSSLTIISIPDGVASIGNSAFRDCSGLTSITIPNSVTTIGDMTFYNCSGLTSITIPNSITSIGKNAFLGCNSLTTPIYTDKIFMFMPTTYSGNYTIPDGIEQIAPNAFKKCTQISNIVLPESITEIGSYAFQGCDLLLNINLPQNVKNIKEYTFEGCNQLQSIDLSKITKLGDRCFASCFSLKQISIPSTLTEVGNDAFAYCDSVNAIYFGGTLEQWCKHNYSGVTAAFYNVDEHHYYPHYGDLYINGNKLINAIIPNSIDTIYEGTFYGISSIRNINIGSGVKYIGASAIESLPDISMIIIGNNVETIYNGNFSYCPNLSYISFGENIKWCASLCYMDTSLTTIEWNVKRCNSEAFNYTDVGQYVTSITFGDKVEVIPDILCMNFSKIESISIPNSVKKIGSGAFYNCESLKNITLHEGLDTIGHGAFSGDTAIISIVLPNSLKVLDEYAFIDCRNLTTITIPNNIATLSDETFQNCTKLSSVSIGDGVKTISATAFSNCTALKSIVIPKNVSSIGDNAFASCTGLRTVRWEAKRCANFSSSTTTPFNNAMIANFSLGDSVEHIPGFLCYNMANLTHIDLPSTLQTIGNNAFDGCISLKELVLPERVTNIGAYALRYCSGIDTLTCWATYPPSVGSYNSGINKEQCVLYIPGGSLQLYKNSYWWSEFADIRAIPNTEQYNITVGIQIEGVDTLLESRDLYLFYDVDSLGYWWNWDELNNIYSEGYLVTVQKDSLNHWTFTAHQSQQYKFIKWDKSNSNPYKMNLWQDSTLTAYFKEISSTVDSVTLTLNVFDDLYGTVSGAGRYAVGDKVTITALPDDGCIFGGWYKPNEDYITDKNPFTFTITSDSTIYASFVPEYCNVIVNSNHPLFVTTSGGGTYNYEQTEGVWVGASAYDSRLKFIQWSDGVKDNPRYVDIFYKEQEYTAEFAYYNSTRYGEAELQDITFIPSSNTFPTQNGTIEISGDKGSGGSVPIIRDNGEFRFYRGNTMTITELNGNNISKLEFQISSQGKQRWAEVTVDTGTITFDVPNGIATWEGNADAITFTVGDNKFGTKAGAGQFCFDKLIVTGLVATQKTDGIVVLTYSDNGCSATGEGEFFAGDTLTISATTERGYAFVKWSDGITENPRTIIVENDSSISAICEVLPNLPIHLQSTNNGTAKIDFERKHYYGDTVTITATAPKGYQFQKWEREHKQIVSVTQALSIAHNLSYNERTTEKYYVVGYIVEEYDKAKNSYYIADSQNSNEYLLAYKLSTHADIGKKVIIDGQLINYMGNTPETLEGANVEEYTDIQFDVYDNPYTFTVTRDEYITAVFVPENGCIPDTTIVNYTIKQGEYYDMYDGRNHYKLYDAGDYYLPTQTNIYGCDSVIILHLQVLQDATPVNMTEDTVIVKPQEHEATITWPNVPSAYTFELIIRDANGEIVCTLIFNGNGQLTGIRFAPKQNRQQTTGFEFTITGLESNSLYSYAITAKDEQEIIIEQFTGTFTTTSDVTTNVDTMGIDTSTTIRKVIINGVLYIVKDGRTYNALGTEVK